MANKKFLITGANGLLGQKFIQHNLEYSNNFIIATGRGPSRIQIDNPRFVYHKMDITDKDSVLECMSIHKPEVVIHAAAMTNVDQCEIDKVSCWKQNVEATQHIIDACKMLKIHMVHVSTDFIFDGTQGPLDENAKPAPLSFYGYSKLVAEEILQNTSDISWSIARTVLVYGIAADLSRTNIVLWVKNSLENNKEIQVVTDQFRTPTLAEDLALGCFLLAESKKKGIYNISGEELLTPYDMAIQVANYFNLNHNLIKMANSSTFSQPAKRPLKTGFIIEKAKKELGYKPHTFTEGIKILAKQLEYKV